MYSCGVWGGLFLLLGPFLGGGGAVKQYAAISLKCEKLVTIYSYIKKHIDYCPESGNITTSTGNVNISILFFLVG